MGLHKNDPFKTEDIKTDQKVNTEKDYRKEEYVKGVQKTINTVSFKKTEKSS